MSHDHPAHIAPRACHDSQPACHEQVPTGLRDPVCGMQVSASSPNQPVHDGTTYDFCWAEYDAKLLSLPDGDEHPAPGAQTTAAEDAPPGTIYTCGMDPEVRQDGPGPCPKCGMALGPLMRTVPEGE